MFVSQAGSCVILDVSGNDIGQGPMTSYWCSWHWCLVTDVIIGT